MLGHRLTAQEGRITCWYLWLCRFLPVSSVNLIAKLIIVLDLMFQKLQVREGAEEQAVEN